MLHVWLGFLMNGVLFIVVIMIMIIYDRLFVNSGILNHKTNIDFPWNLVLFNAVQAQQDIAHPFGFRDNNCSGLLIDRAEKQFGWWGHLGNSAGLEIDSARGMGKTAQLMSWLDLFRLVSIGSECVRLLLPRRDEFVPEVLDKHPQLCLLITRLDCSLTRIRLSDIVSNRHWIALSLEAAIRRSPLYRLDGEGGLQRYANENAKICQAWNWLTNADQCQQISVLVPVVIQWICHISPIITRGDRWKCNAQHFKRSQACSAWSDALHWLQSSLESYQAFEFQATDRPTKVKIILTTIETAWEGWVFCFQHQSLHGPNFALSCFCFGRFLLPKSWFQHIPTKIHWNESCTAALCTSDQKWWLKCLCRGDS